MVKSLPQRMCVGCREMRDKRQLIRVVRSPEGVLSLDATGKKPGRGSYLCPNRDCLKKARKNRGLERNLKLKVEDEIWQQIEEQLPPED